MRVYYLDEPLSDEDLSFVTETFGLSRAPEQVRIPHVLPLLDAAPVSEPEHRRHIELLRGHLRHAGIGVDRDQQVVFVAPREMYWYQVLLLAIADETGMYPYLVQTEAQRRAIGNPGETRILDTHGLMGLKEP